MAAPTPETPISIRAAWPRARRVLVANERLVGNPIARRSAEWIAWLLPVAVAGGGGFDAWARSAAHRDVDLFDILDGSDATLALAALGAVLISVAVANWLLAAFCASIREGRPRIGARPGTVARLIAIDVVATSIVIGSFLVSPGLALLPVLVLPVLLLYPSYAIAIYDLGIRDGFATGLRVLRRAPGPAFLTVGATLLMIQLGLVLLHDPLVDATRIFAPLVLAAILYDGLVTYGSDCVAIAVVLEAEGEPSSAPAVPPAA